MFVDRVILDLTAGKGGNGIVAWIKEKYIPKGGPCGGCGGKGGSIVLEADDQVYSLEWYRNRRLLKAENGVIGGSYNRSGRNGKDLILKVPCGTLVMDSITGEVLHDLTKNKEKVVICAGGKGGRGNQSYKTSTNRAPNMFTEGKDGEVKNIQLELKLIADIGLVGFPNAGKSTLISALADVKVKIAPYPFTTLKPNLGFIQREDYTRIFIADIPGIIEGAHANRGLGLEFLRHIDRTKLLIFMLDASGIGGRNPSDDYNVLRRELTAYEPDLLNRPCFVVLNKVDTEESIEHCLKFRHDFTIDQEQLFEISALTGMGVDNLLKRVCEHPELLKKPIKP